MSIEDRHTRADAKLSRVLDFASSPPIPDEIRESYWYISRLKEYRDAFFRTAVFQEGDRVRLRKSFDMKAYFDGKPGIKHYDVVVKPLTSGTVVSLDWYPVKGWRFSVDLDDQFFIIDGKEFQRGYSRVFGFGINDLEDE